jgi:hypothetical protein
MSISGIRIALSRNGGASVQGWRQDATVGSVITCSLTSSIGVSSWQWFMVGRPEGSGAGGTGPEPVSLGTSATATFTVDVRGTYIVHCIVNSGAPSATILRAGVAYVEAFTDPSGNPLRLIGPGETDEDTSDPLLNHGYAKALNRWLATIRNHLGH